jgi:hypothetical protein
MLMPESYLRYYYPGDVFTTRMLDQQYRQLVVAYYDNTTHTQQA